MPEHPDLVIRAGSIVCPVNGRFVGAVIIRNGRIAAIGPQLDVGDSRVLDFPTALLLPGLIDLHAHPARSGSMFGVEPDRHLLPRGTTTVLSQGDAGADNLEAYLRDTIEASQTRVRLALNISAIGETGPDGCCERLEAIDVAKCVAAINSHRPHIWGIAANASRNACGRSDPREILRRALLAAAETGLPILYGMRCPEDWPLSEQLEQLRAGDVVTYCFRRTPHCIVRNGRVLPEIRAARSRGILFDVGHGRASFDFAVAEMAIANGFLPDTISTDLQRGHMGNVPVHDLPLVMSKLRAAGMTESDIFIAVTSRPATVLGLANEIGILTIGACADLTVLRWVDHPQPLVDTSGGTRNGGQWQTAATIRGGKVVGLEQP